MVGVAVRVRVRCPSLSPSSLRRLASAPCRRRKLTDIACPLGSGLGLRVRVRVTLTLTRTLALARRRKPNGHRLPVGGGGVQRRGLRVVRDRVRIRVSVRVR